MSHLPVRNVVFRRVLLVFSLLGFLSSAVAHVSTYLGIVVQEAFPAVMLLHLFSIVSVGGYVILLRLEDQDTSFLREVLARRLWLPVVLGIFFVYTLVNFGLSVMGNVGSFAVQNGKYVKHSRGKVLKTYKVKATYLRAKRNSDLHMGRGFSGHWLLFFGGIFLLLLADDGRKRTVEEGPFPASVLRESIARGDALVLPQDELFSSKERLKRFTGWRSLLWVIGIQVFVIAVASVVFQFWFGLFIAGFISLNFLNYFFYRKQVKYFLQGIAWSEDTLQLTFAEWDDVQTRQVSLEQLRITIEKKAQRGGPLFSLCFWEGKEKVFEQQAGMGFWTRERCVAVMEGTSAYFGRG